MARKRSLLAPVLLAVALLFGGVGVAIWVLINPDNAFTRLFATPIVATETGVVIGPYPNEDDVQLLARNKVGTIVSLLNPDLPHERVLVEREQALAKKYGMRFLNFPMSSLFGQRFGEDYDKNAQAAAEAIAASETKVYLHCYLGVHRLGQVQKRLAALEVDTSRYTVREADHFEYVTALERVREHYKAKRYGEALAELERLGTLDRGGRMLKAWSLLQIGRIDEAARLFEGVRQENLDHRGARTGLGYVALRRDQVFEAEALFRSVLEDDPEDSGSLGGVGFVAVRHGKLAEAESYLARALAYEPRNTDVAETLAEVRAALASAAANGG